ncbi:MAG TPA: hypothetical protein VFH52_07395 [Rhodanobacteraceae bacterium]|nr:hypothetical protein [Rhodanobacteraceae bacterium]
MTNIRKLMARLNPGSAQYGMIVRGGIPDLTTEDIAGALGMVPQGLGREILCHIWWPDGARTTRAELLSALTQAQFDEWSRLADQLRAAQLAEHLAEHDGRGSLRRARRDLETARAQMWPAIGPRSRYGAIRLAVLTEMAAPNLCTHCAGRGNLMLETVLVACAHCKGLGRVGISGRKRAAAIGCDESTYREGWQLPYEYLHELCVTAEQDAAICMSEALGQRIAA